MYRLLSWAATLAFLPVFGGILLVFDVAQRVAYAFGQRPQEYVASALQWTLLRSFMICGTRFAIERSPRIEPRRSYIIVANHQSMLDIVILGSVFFTNFPKYVSKVSLARGFPSVSYNLRRGGHVLIDRADGTAAREAIRDLGRRVHAGRCSAMIFPEGTRARHGELGPFKPGGTLALLEEAPETPVVPVAIDESWRVLLHNYFPVPFGVRVRVRVGDPIVRRAGEDPRDILARTHAEIAKALADWRGTADGA
jgi:1-acyl-sn-glycerol-3-phosphate acyltransferase